MELGRKDADGGGNYGYPGWLPNGPEENEVTHKVEKPTKNRIEKQMTNWRIYLQHLCCKGLMSLLYKELLQINEDDEQHLVNGHGQAIYWRHMWGLEAYKKLSVLPDT